MTTATHLPDDLLKQAKRVALESGTTLTAIIEEALREWLARREERLSQPIRITSVGGSGLLAGVDLDDSAALLDLMERPDTDP